MINLLWEAQSLSGQPAQDLVQLALDLLLEPEGTENSVYATATAERQDIGHALGVVAASIAVDAFDKDARQEHYRKLDAAEIAPKPKLAEVGRKLVTLTVPRSVLGADVRVRFTPKANKNFSPADERHFDLLPTRSKDLATRIVESVRDRGTVCTVLQKEEHRMQAAIVLAFCLEQFDGLKGNKLPRRWRDGESLPASEQLARLRFVADDKGRQARLGLNRS